MPTCAICTRRQNQTASISGTKIKRDVEGSSGSDLYETGPNTSVLCDDNDEFPPMCGKKVWSLRVPMGRGCGGGPRPLEGATAVWWTGRGVSHFGYVHIQSRSMAPQHTTVISSGLKHKPGKKRRRFEGAPGAVPPPPPHPPRTGPRRHSPIRLMHWLLLCPLSRSNTPRRSRPSPGSCGLERPSGGGGARNARQVRICRP